MSHFPFDLQLFEILGVMGFALYVFNYTMLTLRFVSGNSIRYFVVNLTAASLVLSGLSVSFNLAAAMIQVFFIVMSLLGILLRLSGRSAIL